MIKNWILFFSYAVGMIGLCAGVGWVFHLPALIQIHAGFAPMQLNTAILFSLVSLNFMVVRKNRQALGAGISVLIILLSGLSFLQYLFGMDFGIDQLFMKSYLPAIPSHPGRMAPNTAVCFILSGFSLIESKE